MPDKLASILRYAGEYKGRPKEKGRGLVHVVKHRYARKCNAEKEGKAMSMHRSESRVVEGEYFGRCSEVRCLCQIQRDVGKF